LEGAKLGAVFGGGISAVSNFSEVIQGKKEIKKAVIDTTVETVKSAADGAVKNAVGSMAKITSTRLAEKVGNEVAKKALGSAAPVIVAFTLVESAKDVYRYANGEIEGEEVIKNTGKNIATASAAWAGAEAGAALGTMLGGPIGGAIGGLVGGVLGALGVGSLFD
jgi:hypothetical protein